MHLVALMDGYARSWIPSGPGILATKGVAHEGAARVAAGLCCEIVASGGPDALAGLKHTHEGARVPEFVSPIRYATHDVLVPCGPRGDVGAAADGTPRNGADVASP